MQTFEIDYPWIVYSYKRTDRMAMVLGGLIHAQCAICGKAESMWLSWWGIWFPPKVPKNHWKRDRFIRRHRHISGRWISPEGWALPLLNPKAPAAAAAKYAQLERERGK